MRIDRLPKTASAEKKAMSLAAMSPAAGNGRIATDELLSSIEPGNAQFHMDTTLIS